MNGWLDFEDGTEPDGTVWLIAKPKRFYWLHLSFWVMAIRSRSLMPTAPRIEDQP